ncbi:MAG: type III-B CRISPR-associated protein Cas10/Cmr2 [Puniceicoccales bacterium]|jgi:CRISPR-associated protein Cmr2|nr:type III-B CRISPR-associated protein Cas10/Cmr2 [Puniceicoccales bacterium]
MTAPVPAFDSNAGSSARALLRFQIGPVQDFIAAARSTRDLWSGSYLLSWLVAHGVKAAIDDKAEVVFPACDGEPKQPLLELLKSKAKEENAVKPDAGALLVPNFANVFVLKITEKTNGNAADVARKVENTIRDEWTKIAGAVWSYCEENRLNADAAVRERFEKQVEKFLSIAWAATPNEGGEEAWRENYKRNGRVLDAVRQTRDFAANSAAGWHANLGAQFGNAAGAAFLNEKDSLTGALEAVADGKIWHPRAPERDGVKNRLDDDLLFSAPTLIKRFWDLAYLKREHSISFEKVANTCGIANHEPCNDEVRANADAPKYFAVLKFDGDSVGQWVSGEKTDNACEKFHTGFSAALSKFALEEVPPIVKEHDGFLIYAGGDDVLALLPADTALDCATKLRDAYREALDEFKDKETGAPPDGSVGIAIAHFKAPLQDVVHAASDAEKRKGKLNRSAVNVTLIKRSGGITLWDNKWDFAAIPLCDALAKAMSDDDASAKLPHRIITLLAPYLDKSTPLVKSTSATDFDVVKVVEKEIAHALSRQVSDRKTREGLTTLFAGYLSELHAYASGTDFILNKLIGLCTAAAFAKRTKREEKSQKSNP